MVHCVHTVSDVTNHNNLIRSLCGGARRRTVWSQVMKICGVIRIKLNQFVLRKCPYIITILLRKWLHNNKHFNSSQVYFNLVVKRPNSKSYRRNEYKNTQREKRSLPHIMAEKNSWHRYGMKKLHHCHPMYSVSALHLFHFIYLFISPHQDGTIKTSKSVEFWKLFLQHWVTIVPQDLTQIVTLSYHAAGASWRCI